MFASAKKAAAGVAAPNNRRRRTIRFFSAAGCSSDGSIETNGTLQTGATTAADEHFLVWQNEGSEF